jgi:predicted amidohydrolase
VARSRRTLLPSWEKVPDRADEGVFAVTSMRIAAAQTPEFRNDVDAALAWADTVVAEAAAGGAALLCFPEAYLQGYLTDEHAAHDAALDFASDEFEAIAVRLSARGYAVVLGLIERDGERVHNTAVVLADGRLVGRYRKINLLSGERVFTPGAEVPVFEIAGLRFGINICFDTNFTAAAGAARAQGASLIVCPSNNMMPAEAAAAWKDKHNSIRGERCRETGLWMISADVTGTRDDRVAWGPTAVLDPAGNIAAQLPLDAPGLLFFDLPLAPATAATQTLALSS